MPGFEKFKKYLAQLNTLERLWADMAECWELIVLVFSIVLSKYVGEINLQLYILDCSFINTCQKCIYYSVFVNIFVTLCQYTNVIFTRPMINKFWGMLEGHKPSQHTKFHRCCFHVWMPLL